MAKDHSRRVYAPRANKQSRKQRCTSNPLFGRFVRCSSLASAFGVSSLQCYRKTLRHEVSLKGHSQDRVFDWQHQLIPLPFLRPCEKLNRICFVMIWLLRSPLYGTTCRGVPDLQGIVYLSHEEASVGVCYSLRGTRGQLTTPLNKSQ